MRTNKKQTRKRSNLALMCIMGRLVGFQLRPNYMRCVLPNAMGDVLLSKRTKCFLVSCIDIVFYVYVQFAILGYPKVFNKQLLAQLTLMVLGRCRNFFRLSWFGCMEIDKSRFCNPSENPEPPLFSITQSRDYLVPSFDTMFKEKNQQFLPIIFPLNNFDLKRLVHPEHMA